MLVTEANKKTCEEIKMIAIKAVRIYVTSISVLAYFQLHYNLVLSNYITSRRELDIA